MTNSVLELLDTLIRDSQEALRCSLFGLIVGEIPNTVLERELLIQVSNLGKDSDLEVLCDSKRESARELMRESRRAS